jgi:hypothetical protein
VHVTEKKKQWATPTIQRYGSFETVTQGCNKDYGGEDGYLFQGQNIVCVSGS